jgi:hypothetical protein
MGRGKFYNKNTLEIVKPEYMEIELPEKFRMDSMKHHEYPKYEYISLLGVICCAGCSYVDKRVLDTVLFDNELHNDSIEFLCNRYIFYCSEMV